MRKILFILILLLFTTKFSYGQIGTRNNGNGNGLIELKFLNSKIESSANQSFFNILTIKNKSEVPFSGKIKFTQPANWSVVGESEVVVNLSSNDSLNLPLRVIVSNTVFGEIAYAVVASLINKDEHPIQSEYCFINIPRLSDLKIESPKDVIYFDNKTETAKFQYKISNQGNTNEIIQLNLKGDEYLAIDNKSLSDEYAIEYNIPAHTDTVFDITILLRDNEQDKSFYKIDLNTYSQDSLHKNSLWINKINNNYSHIIPENYKCAIFELTAHDILSTRTAQYSLLAKGQLLFKNNIDFYYYLRKNDLSSDWSNYNQTRAYIGVRTKHLQLQGGTFNNIFHQYSPGLGGKVDLKFDKFSSEAFYVNNEEALQTFYGGQINFSVVNSLKMKLGYAENSIELYRNYSQIALSGINFSFLKKNRFSVEAYANKTTCAQNTPFDKVGYAIISNYSANFNRIRATFRVDYGSPEYSGLTRGRFSINSNINYQINTNSAVFFNYYKSDYKRSTYVNDIQLPFQIQNFDKYDVTYNRHVNKSLSIYTGTTFKYEGFNTPYFATNPTLMFKTINPRVFFYSRIKFGNSSFMVTPKFDIGNIRVIEALDLANSDSTNYNTYNLYLNLVSDNFGLYLQYRNGPFGINEQYYFHSVDYYSRWLFLMPSYNKFFFKKRLHFSISANYRMNINSQESDLSFYPQLSLYLPNFWTIRLLGSNSTRKRIDIITNSSVRYNTTYFEASIRKEFSCKQPRFQYHDLDVVFFKDLNGNRVKEANEPGLRNVLTSIEYDVNSREEVKEDFVSTKLLTGANGKVSYSNIVNGDYLIKYILIGDMVGNFNREEVTHPFRIDKDKTIYIPYLENNRIVGKVILNRDPLSSLGPLDVSNIRVIAEDTKQRTYSALTDKKGNFILYTPVADHYVVKINNIFYESFDLQQSEFVVKFNGYKQFEVAFVFNEKKRKINFDTDVAVEDEFKMDELKAIKKTTLSGKIRDAISLEPIDARIEIISNKTGNKISNSVSNRLNGNYSISYVAGDNFRIEVKADGYWDHVENLYIEQVISIQNIAKDIMLNKTSGGTKKQTFIIYDEEEEDKFTENFKSGQKIPMNNLNFAERETRLSPNLYPELDRLIDVLGKNKTVRIQVAGHADDSGKDRIDNLLALRRARAVAKYLTSHGLTENRIEVKSYSNKRPLVPGNSEKAKQKNRRVEIIVL